MDGKAQAADGSAPNVLTQIRDDDLRVTVEVGELLLPNVPPGRLDARFTLVDDVLDVQKLDLAAAEGLRVMVGLPWSQHVAFLDDRALKRKIRQEIAGKVAELGDHPALLAFALGNEIPPGVVRWHGRMRVERFLRALLALTLTGVAVKLVY